MEIFNNTDIILNISKYLIEPSILILDHKYTKDNKIQIIIDNYHTNSQINNYLIYINSVINNKFQLYLLDSFTLFLKIINDINNMNLFWRNTGHTIYFDGFYLKNQWRKSKTFTLDLTSYNTYKKTYLNYLQIDKLSIIKDYNLIKQHIETKIDLFEKNTKIHELQFIMKYWNIYFQDYLYTIDNDLSLFKVSDLINFINTEENIFYELIREE
jgi:hypothetical protein